MYQLNTPKRSATLSLLKFTFNGANAPVLIEDVGHIAERTGHVRDSAGNYTIALKRSHVTIDGWATVSGADADMVKVVPSDETTNEVALIALRDDGPHVVGDLVSKTVSVWLYTSRSPQTMI